jgi:FMN phosphatase YigB (HAD superfamily)
MVHIDVISFDMEGTLIDHNFSDLIWETDIPMLYGQQNELDFETARERVLAEYRKVGEERSEWYDVGYWFKRLGLEGDWRELPQRRWGDCRAYPEASSILERLSESYTLIIASNTIQDFLEVQLRRLPRVFSHIFSAPSDFNTVKKSENFYRKVYRILRVPPTSIVHVGDNRRFDYEDPRQLGIHAYYLDRSSESEGEHVVHDLIEFEGKLRELDGRLQPSAEAIKE